MKNHVWRPLFVVIGLVVFILLVRMLYVPVDFNAQEKGYTFGYHRLSNEQEWKDYPAKYKESGYCLECHPENTATLAESAHAMIPCENCHGAALQHPDAPELLTVDRSRELCVRCHSSLFMPSSGRSAIPGIDPAEHNVDELCSDCHNPHNPSLEEM
ncbi:MAG: cytochrome C [Desulfuromonadales bacterium]|nr:cytochrome C [Desulfuromonadales bacterium]